MFGLTQSWREAMTARNPRIRVLLTIGVGKLYQIPDHIHPARWTSTLRASTHNDSFVTSNADSEEYPFWGTITKWPDIKLSIKPEERRYDNVSVSVTLNNLSGYLDKFEKTFATDDVWGRLDLWTEGVPLEDTIPLVAGQLENPQWSTPGDDVSLTIKDKHDAEPTGWPFENEFLDNDEFPVLPLYLRGRARRKYVFGPVLGLLECFQIDNVGKEFYYAEPQFEFPPQEFYIGDVEVSKTFTPIVKTARTAITGELYTKIVFPRSINSEDYTGQVFAGGPNTVGADPTRIIPTILSRVPGLRFTARAKTYLSYLERIGIFDYYALITGSGNPLTIVMERLLAQTGLAAGWRTGRLDIFKLGSATPQTHFEIGSNLIDRIRIKEPKTKMESVKNAIEVSYRRHHIRPHDDGTFGQYKVLVDSHLPSAVQSLLISSEANYGRRLLKVDAADLWNPQNAKELGESIAGLTAFQHRKYSYQVEYRHALRTDLNYRVELSDELEGLVDKKCRVVELDFKEDHVEITFQTDDLDG